jgi:hypothetical protein
MYRIYKYGENENYYGGGLRVMKNKFMGNVSKSLLVVLSGFLFVIWLGSILNLGGNFGGISEEVQLGQQEALASTNDLKKAYQETLDFDTIYVEDIEAAAGDSFWVTLGIHNTFSIAGWRCMLTYNAGFPGDPLIYPDLVMTIDTIESEDTVYVDTAYILKPETTPRTEQFDWYLFSVSPRYEHEDTVMVTALVDIPATALLDSGRGPVMRLKFWVSEDAQPQQYTDITFVPWDILPNQQANPANIFVDETGLNEYIPQVLKGRLTVKEGGEPGNNDPVFTAPTQLVFEVNEGTRLEFWVRATDEDGDTITLSLDPMDLTGSPDYSFPTTQGVGSVEQKFSYTPQFGEAGTKYIRFKAADHRGGLTNRDVQIIVNETAQDLLMASSIQGGVPGSADRWVPFMITNSSDIYGFQFTFRWDPGRLWLDSIVCTDVLDGFSVWHNLEDSVYAGNATVLVFGLAGETIPAGLDTIIYPAFSVYEDAEPGEVDILVENAREAINPGYPSQPLTATDGIFFIDRFGDANLDKLVDVGDVVSLVHYILGYLTFNTREEMAADANQDTLINVGDMVAMIDMIMGSWMGPSPPMYPGSMAEVELDYEDLLPGSSGEVKIIADLEVPAAGAQFEISYDPEQVSFQVPVLAGRADHFLMEYRDNKNGSLKVLLYNMSNNPIPVGEGNIISIPATLSSYVEEKANIELKQVVLADQKAALIPVGGGEHSVPVAFELNQNYPNPFNPSTTIKFTLPSQHEGGALNTTLRIYNVLGELVRTLVDEPMAPGTHDVMWDGKDESGSQVASGIYFYRLRSGDFQDTKKMVMMK